MSIVQGLLPSEMFHVLLFFVGFVTVETNRKHLLCNTAMIEAMYEMCDDSFTPVVKVEPCELSKHSRMNFSVTIIPRKNIDLLYCKVQIWKDSVTVSDRRYELCSGFDDNYDFCGALKGETVNIFYHDIKFNKFPPIKGVYTVKILLIVGEREEQLACFLLTMKLKATF